MSLFKEFKDFISRGNIFDMSVGVIVGGAFSKIVTALTQTVIMPVITIFTGKLNVSELTAMIGSTEIPYGQFLQAVIDFLITAAAIFVMIKAVKSANERMSGLTHKKEEDPEPEPAPEPSEEEKLLREIRDLLKSKE